MNIGFYKTISVLPSSLEPSAMYAVRAGAGFDLYVSDATGAVAHKLNTGGAADPAYQPGATSITEEFIYTVYLSTDGNTYKIRRSDRETQAQDYATGAAPIPEDLTTLTYVS